MSKHWTYEELKYLIENIHKKSLNKIAKKLNRTPIAIKLKLTRIKYTKRVYKQEEITFADFTKILGYSYDSSDLRNRLKREGFPFSKFKIINKEITMVNLQSFLRWFKTHLHLLDISKTKNGDFNAIEPEWLIEKRKADKLAAEYMGKRKWTPAEDRRLIDLLKQYHYGYRNISIRLKRSEGAIKRRMCDLQLKERPLRESSHEKWTEEQIKIVKDLYLKGYKSCIIAEYVPKSALAINGLLERHNYFREMR